MAGAGLPGLRQRGPHPGAVRPFRKPGRGRRIVRPPEDRNDPGRCTTAPGFATGPGDRRDRSGLPHDGRPVRPRGAGMTAMRRGAFSARHGAGRRGPAPPPCRRSGAHRPPDRPPGKDRCAAGRGLARQDTAAAIGARTAAGIAPASVNDRAGLAAHPHLRMMRVETPAGPVSLPAPPVRVPGESFACGPVPALPEPGT